MDGTDTPGERWPSFFIVGGHRCGTTSLYNYLGAHPGVFLPTTKEPNFFTKLHRVRDDPERVEEAKEAYLALFEPADPDQVLGEASTAYLWHPHVPDLIHQQVPKARIVMSLRDPVERAYSHYWLHRAGGSETRSFGRAIEEELSLDGPGIGNPHRYIRDGLYADSVRRYVDRFGRENVKIILFPELTGDPRGTVEQVATFLDLDPAGFEDADTDRVYNAFRGLPMNTFTEWVRTNPTVRRVAQAVLPKRLRDFIGNRVLLREGEKPPMEEEVRATLEDLFEPQIEALEDALERNLPELRRSWTSGDAP